MQLRRIVQDNERLGHFTTFGKSYEKDEVFHGPSDTEIEQEMRDIQEDTLYMVEDVRAHRGKVRVATLKPLLQLRPELGRLAQLCLKTEKGQTEGNHLSGRRPLSFTTKLLLQSLVVAGICEYVFLQESLPQLQTQSPVFQAQAWCVQLQGLNAFNFWNVADHSR